MRKFSFPVLIAFTGCFLFGCDSGSTDVPAAPDAKKRADTSSVDEEDEGDIEQNSSVSKKAYDDSDILFENVETSIAILPIAAAEAKPVATPTPATPDPLNPAPAPAPNVPVVVTPQTPATNQSVIDFANSRLGAQVGNGLCADLQAVALATVGAKIVSSFANATAAGTAFSLLADDEPLFPGDVMHWDGNTNHNNYPAKAGDPLAPKIAGYLMFKAVPEGHVSIVREVISPVEIKILHQNINNLKVVREDTIRLDAIVAGKIQFFRPVPK